MDKHGKRDASVLSPEENLAKKMATSSMEKVSDFAKNSDSENVDLSVKTHVSTTKSMNNNNTDTDPPLWATSLFGKLEKKIDDLDISINKSLEFTSTRVSDLEKEVKEVNFKQKQTDTSIDILTNKLSETEKENKLLKEKLIDIENRSRRSNLIIKGFDEQVEHDNGAGEASKHDLAQVKKLFKETMKIENELSIGRCHRLGKKSNLPRPIIIYFDKFGDREQVWARRADLKNTEYSISEDYSVETVRVRNELFPFMIAARKLEYRATIIVDKLFIENKKYGIDDLMKLPQGLRPNDVFTKSQGGTTVFYSKHAALSNFHACKFQVDGHIFNSVEQFLAAKKCEMANDVVSCVKVMNSDAAGAYAIAKTIPEEDDWQIKCQDIMYRGMYEKFSQNKELRAELLATKQNVLGECKQSDNFWGNGKRLWDADVCSTSTWKGKNITGKMLMKVREDLKG